MIESAITRALDFMYPPDNMTEMCSVHRNTVLADCVTSRTNYIKAKGFHLMSA